MLDATTGGSLMALSDHQAQHIRGQAQRKSEILEFGMNDAILAQNKLLKQTVEKSPRNFQNFHNNSSNV